MLGPSTPRFGLEYLGFTFHMSRERENALCFRVSFKDLQMRRTEFEGSGQGAPPPDLPARSPPKFKAQECGLKMYELTAVWVADDVVASPHIERPILELNVTVLRLLLNPKIKPYPTRATL